MTYSISSQENQKNLEDSTEELSGYLKRQIGSRCRHVSAELLAGTCQNVLDKSGYVGREFIIL
jgi:ABC-type phosphate/phosphonate transport system substrate-binding protein